MRVLDWWFFIRPKERVKLCFTSCYSHSLYFPVHTIGRRYPIRALVRGCAGRGPAGIFGSCRWGQEQEGRISPLSPTPGGSGWGDSIIWISKASFDFRLRRVFWIIFITTALMKTFSSPESSPSVHLRSPAPTERPHPLPCTCPHPRPHFCRVSFFHFCVLLLSIGSGSIFLCTPFSLAPKSVASPRSPTKVLTEAAWTRI